MNNLIGVSGKINSGKDTVGKILQYLEVAKYPSGEDYNNWLQRGGFAKEVPTYQIKKYADKLKDIVCLLTGCTIADLEDREFKESKLSVDWDDSHGIDTYRDLIQLLGTEAGRDIIHPNIWVNALFADYKNNFTPCEHWEKDRENINCMCGGINAMGANKGITNCESEGKLPNWIITDVRFPNELKAIEDRGGIVIRVNRDYQNPLMPDIAIPEHESETALDNYEFDHVIDNNGSLDELVEKVKQLNLA